MCCVIDGLIVVRLFVIIFAVLSDILFKKNLSISLLVCFICFSSFSLFVTLCNCWFFFFRQMPAYEMRISDGSSDVCSSDLVQSKRAAGMSHPRAASSGLVRIMCDWGAGCSPQSPYVAPNPAPAAGAHLSGGAVEPAAASARRPRGGRRGTVPSD